MGSKMGQTQFSRGSRVCLFLLCRRARARSHEEAVGYKISLSPLSPSLSHSYFVRRRTLLIREWLLSRVEWFHLSNPARRLGHNNANSRATRDETFGFACYARYMCV